MIKTGSYIPSRKWLDPNTNKPLLMKITRVAGGLAYYRPCYGLHDDGSEWLGAPASFPVADADYWIEIK